MRRLAGALALNAGFLVVEVAFAVAFSSLALAADAAHASSDVIALSLALVASRLARRPANKRHSYGLGRTEVLAALANSVLLVGVTLWVVVEAVHRFSSPTPVRGAGLTAVGACGVVVNAAAAGLLLRGEARGNVNVRAAALHMLADVAGSVAATAAGVVALAAHATWSDPAASLAISLLVLAGTWRLLRETVHTLLEGTPSDIDPHEVETAILDLPHVDGVHHLHVWSVGPGTTALSGHVVAADGATLHDAQVIADAVRTLLADRFGIAHATLEMECHDCEVETPVALRHRH